MENLTENQKEFVNSVISDFTKINDSLSSPIGSIIDIDSMKKGINLEQTKKNNILIKNKRIENLRIEQIKADFELLSRDLKEIGINSKLYIQEKYDKYYISVGFIDIYYKIESFVTNEVFNSYMKNHVKVYLSCTFRPAPQQFTTIKFNNIKEVMSHHLTIKEIQRAEVK
jgi:hypothetical protein